MERRADDYLIKPFSAREFAARVAAHVALAQLRREVAARRAQEKLTTELRDLNDSLLAEVAVRRQTEDALRRSEADLLLAQKLARRVIGDIIFLPAE